MELPRTVTQVAGTLNPTADHLGTGNSSGVTAGRLRVVRAGTPVISGSEELSEQLRKRLRFIACIAVTGCALALTIRLVQHGRELFSEPWQWNIHHGTIAEHIALLVVQTWVIVRLASHRRQTLKQLRVVEILIILTLSLFFTQNKIAATFRHQKLFPEFWATEANASVLPYAVILVSYGVLIPNTWQRCAFGVGLISAGAYIGPAVGFCLVQQPIGVIVAYFAQITIWLGIAGAIVIYGAYRIEVLREQADRGRELGQYRLRCVLGVGGMGEVYLAEHILLSRPCAIKLISSDRTGDSATIARFEREVQTTATLAHPHIVRIHDYGRTDDGTFYCVMEYLNGITLDELVNQHGRLPPERAVFVLRQLCSALAEAHAAGLTHRDVKPGNVIIRNRGRQSDFATLLDFGLVLDRGKGDDKMTREGMPIGTPSFMAPEQAAGDRVDHCADLYAVGAVGYFLLTGRPPFAAGSAMRTVAAVLTEPVPPLGRTDVPTTLEAIIHQCMSKAPSDRFKSADELNAALAACGCDVWSHELAAGWWAGTELQPTTSSPPLETNALT
jgi:eukaryotic-like serine/threonine-protein kinase